MHTKIHPLDPDLSKKLTELLSNDKELIECIQLKYQAYTISKPIPIIGNDGYFIGFGWSDATISAIQRCDRIIDNIMEKRYPQLLIKNAITEDIDD